LVNSLFVPRLRGCVSGCGSCYRSRQLVKRCGIPRPSLAWNLPLLRVSDGQGQLGLYAFKCAGSHIAVSYGEIIRGLQTGASLTLTQLDSRLDTYRSHCWYRRRREMCCSCHGTLQSMTAKLVSRLQLHIGHAAAALLVLIDLGTWTAACFRNFCCFSCGSRTPFWPCRTLPFDRCMARR
jgi:hypothetical protein